MTAVKAKRIDSGQTTIEAGQIKELKAGFDGLVAHGARNYWKSHHLKELTDDCIDKILEYVNFLSEGENRAKEAYTPRVWNRLVEVKRNWDPQNLFRINQNIKP